MTGVINHLIMWCSFGCFSRRTGKDNLAILNDQGLIGERIDFVANEELTATNMFTHKLIPRMVLLIPTLCRLGSSLLSRQITLPQWRATFPGAPELENGRSGRLSSN